MHILGYSARRPVLHVMSQSQFALHPPPFPALQCWLIKCGDSSLSEGMLVCTMPVLIPQCYFL